MNLMIFPEDFTASVIDLSSDVIAGLMPLVIIFLGVVLGFFIVERVIRIFRRE